MPNKKIKPFNKLMVFLTGITIGAAITIAGMEIYFKTTTNLPAPVNSYVQENCRKNCDETMNKCWNGCSIMFQGLCRQGCVTENWHCHDMCPEY